MSDLQEKRVEAAARALYEYETGLGADSWGRAFEVERSLWRDEARTALEAADAVCCTHPKCPGGSLCCCQSDAVVTEEMIAETILKALVFTNENSEAWADGLARDIAALFRGGAK